MTYWINRLAFVCLTTLLSASCAINPVSRKSELVFMSESEEIELGRSFHEQFLSQDRVYGDNRLQAYVNSIGQSLATVSHRSSLDYHFTVIDSPEVNAFALPGGYIYIARGMLAYLNSEAELAAVLGHEIGHVAARHAVRKDVRQKAENFLGQSLFNRIGFGVDRSYNGYARARGIDYSQAYELEADELAVEYLLRSGYAPTAMSNVISTIQGHEHLVHQSARNGPASELYHGFNTHPDSALRKTLVDRELQRLDDELPAARNMQRREYLEHIDGLVFGPSEHGRIIDGRFIHASSRTGFSIPAGWHADNSGRILKLVAPDEGAVIQVLNKPHFTGTTARQHLHRLLISDDLRDEQPLPGAGIDGWMAVSTKQVREGEIPVWLATSVADDMVWIMVGTAGDVERYHGAIEASMRSFHRPSAEDLARAEPRRIRVTRAGPGTTYAALAAESPLASNPEQQLRLLNGQTGADQQPLEGSLIKRVE